MAKTLSSASIATSNTILAWHVTQSVDALTGNEAYNITISGSLKATGSVGISGLLSATPGTTHQLTSSNAISSSYALTSSYAVTSSYAITSSHAISSSYALTSSHAISSSYALTSSYASTVPSSGLPSGLISSSNQIATQISGAFTAPSASFSTRVTNNATNIFTLTSKTGSYAVTASNAFKGNQIITGSLITSGSRVTFEVSGSTSRNVFILDDNLAFNNNNITDGSNKQRGNLVVAYESGSRYKGIAVVNAVTSSDVNTLNYIRIGHIESGSGDHFSSQLAFTEQPLISLNSEGDVLGMTVSGSYGDGGNVNTGVIYFGDDGTDKMVIGSKRGSEIIFNPIMVFSQAKAHGTGSVGIGIANSNPSAKLHVSLSSAVGTAFKAEGIATFEGNITASGDISASNIVYGKTGSFSHLQGNSPFTIGDIVTFQQAVSSSGGLYVTSSTGYTGALLDVNGHLLVENTGAITGSGGVYITSSAGQSTALLDVNGHLQVENSGIVDMTGAGAISGSTFSGSFVGNGSGLTDVFEGTATSASISTRITANEVITAKTLISSSNQIATQISGAFTAPSASFSTRISANEVITAKTLISSSNQISTQISGAFTAPSASFSTRVTANEVITAKTLISSSDQIATQISGAFTSTSASLASSITTNTTNITSLTLVTESYATTGSNQFNGNQIISGSLIVSSSGGVKPLLIGDYVGIGDPFLEGAVPNAQLHISGSGTQTTEIESSNGSAVLKLVANGSGHAFIDLEEGSDQRWILGNFDSDDSFRIASGSAFSNTTLFELDRNGKITVQADVSSSLTSTASFGTYIGDASHLVNIPGSSSFSTRVTANESNISTNTSNISTNTTNITTLTSKTGSYATTGSNQFNGNQQITGSLTLSGSLYFTSNVITTVEDGATTLNGSEQLVMIDASSGNVTINLPLAGSFPGKQINFKVIADPGSYTMTLQRQGSDTIDGATSNASLDTRYEALSVISDGVSQWLIF